MKKYLPIFIIIQMLNYQYIAYSAHKDGDNVTCGSIYYMCIECKNSSLLASMDDNYMETPYVVGSMQYCALYSSTTSKILLYNMETDKVLESDFVIKSKSNEVIKMYMVVDHQKRHRLLFVAHIQSTLKVCLIDIQSDDMKLCSNQVFVFESIDGVRAYYSSLDNDNFKDLVIQIQNEHGCNQLLYMLYDIEIEGFRECAKDTKYQFNLFSKSAR